MDGLGPWTYRVTWSTEDGQYVGTVDELPSLSWLADHPVDAFKGIYARVTDYELDRLEEYGLIPFDQAIAEAKRDSLAFRLLWGMSAPARKIAVWRLRR